ncbi:MAG: sigma-70 family RNA polymerase sigma factor [Myxococcota bacterium]
MHAHDDIAALVVRAQAGEANAQEVLVRRFLRPAYVVALSVTRDVADAEDVAQDSMMNALLQLDQCQQPDRFSAWLLRSVRHRAMTMLTQRKTRAGLLAKVPAPAGAGEDPSRIIARQPLLDALEALNETQREVVLLHDLQDWKHAEIASALEISETMSRQHLFVARRLMRARLGATSDTEGSGE